MPLNPDRNLYSVGDIGPNIVIARSIALRGGLTRENCLNLTAWLIIAGRFTPEELRAEIAKASQPIPKAPQLSPTLAKAPSALPGPAIPPPGPQAPAAPPAPAVAPPIAPEVLAQVAPTMGELDPEEAAAVAAAAEALTASGPVQVPHVNGAARPSAEDAAKAWGG